MSINSAMLSGVSGLTANAAALSAISQNIANVNTIGYKRSQAEFETLVNSHTQSAGYSAGGVMAHSRQFISQSGQMQRTSSATDLAIAGSGFFVVTEQAEGLEPTDGRLFTRAGAFRVDDLGYLKNTAGLYLQGWPVDTYGAIQTDPSDLSRLESINVGAVGGTAEATTRVQLNANLRDSQAVSTAAQLFQDSPADVDAYNPATNSMAMWDPETGTGVKPDFELTIPISDSKGGQRTMAMSFLKGANANEWHVEIRAVPADDVVPGAGLNNGQIKTGMIAFTQDGRLDPAATAALADPLFPDVLDASLTFGASGDAPGAGEFSWADGLGIAEQTLDFDLTSAAGGLTQYNSPSVVQATFTNGTNFGSLKEVQIDDEGFVTAMFDNGVSRRIAQVALATFPSPDNLVSVNGNAFAVSQESGTYNLKAPGQGGSGFLGSQQLESSTVDLSTEFTGLITTQRAYSASSKIITTADQMLEELLMIKR